MAQNTEAELTPDPADAGAEQPAPTRTDPVGEGMPAEAAPRRSSALPLILGGVIAAGLGAGAAFYAGKLYPALLSEPADTSVDARLAAQAAEIAALTDRLAALPQGQTPDSETAAALSDVLARQKALEEGLATLSERVARLESLPLGQSGASTLDIAAATEAATKAARAAEEEAARLKAEAERATRRATLIAASGELTAALESGAALQPGLDLLQGTGLAVPAALADVAQGAPTLRALRDTFPGAARDALAISLRATADGDLWSRFTAFLRSQTGARSLAPVAGDDPDAILSRAEGAVVSGDLETALGELAALPPDGQARMAEWMGLANRRLAAEKALAALQAEIAK